MFRKFATATVTRVYDSRSRTAGTKLSGFDYEPRTDGRYLYAAVRACTADVPNLNYDMLPDRELKTAYKTFVGAYNYLNHDNQDPAKARGAVIDARYHTEDPDDKWIECLIEMDEDRCPKLCSLIRSGEIDTVSMGCNVESTTCSVCGKTAEYPFQYCEHIQQKGRTFGGKVAYEICNGIDFFELSWVYDPADPTAHTEKVAHAGAERFAGEDGGHVWSYRLEDCLEPVLHGVVDSPIGPYHPPHMEGGISISLLVDGAEVCRLLIDGAEFDGYVENHRIDYIIEDVEYMLRDCVNELNEYQLYDFESVMATIDYWFSVAFDDVKWFGRTASVRTAAPSGGFKTFMDRLFKSLNSVKSNGVDKWKKSVEKNTQHAKKLKKELDKYKEHEDGYYYQDNGSTRYIVSQDGDSGKWQFAEMKKNRAGGYDPISMSNTLFDSYEDAVSAYLSSKEGGSSAASMFTSGDELKEAVGSENYGTSEGADSDGDKGDGVKENKGSKGNDVPKGSHLCGRPTKPDGEPCNNLVSDSEGEDAPCYAHRDASRMSVRDRMTDYISTFPDWEQEDILRDLEDNGIVDDDDLMFALDSRLCDLEDSMDISKYRYAGQFAENEVGIYSFEGTRWASVCGSGSFATAPRIPDEVDIDSENVEACPLCGDPNFDGEFCDVCGYEEPPEGFGDIQIEDVSDYDEYEQQESEGEEEDFDFGFDDDYDYAAEEKADQLAESGQEAADEFGDEEVVEEDFVEEEPESGTEVEEVFEDESETVDDENAEEEPEDEPADEDDEEPDTEDKRESWRASKKTAMFAETFEYGFIDRNDDFYGGMVHIDDEEGLWTCEIYGTNGDDFDGFGTGDTYPEAVAEALADTGLNLDDSERVDLIEHIQFMMDEQQWLYSQGDRTDRWYVDASKKTSAITPSIIERWEGDDGESEDHYQVGLYDCYVARDGDGSIRRVDVTSSAFEKYLPDIYYRRDAFGRGDRGFEIQTTAYGSLPVGEIEQVIDGYYYAIDAVEAMEVLLSELRSN